MLAAIAGYFAAAASADFTFAGGRWPGRFVFGEDFYRVHADDHPAFHAAFPEGGA